jgi:hypothetical protein
MLTDVDRVNALVQEDRQITVIDIANKWICIFRHPRGPRVSQNMCKLVAKAAYRGAQWARMEFLQGYHGEAFLQRIVTGDGGLVHHYEPASKFRSMEWKHVIAQVQEIQNCASCR